MNVYNGSGASVLPDNTPTNVVGGSPRDVGHAVDLNSFFGYPAAVNRTTGLRGQFVTDPSCLYDAATHRFFLVVLTLEVDPATGDFTTQNHLDLAVTQTANPTGQWNIYRLDVTNDGTNTGGKNPGPFLGDYPHIGADANGFYITTNAYPWTANGFAGAQVYALSKAQLARGAANVRLQHWYGWQLHVQPARRLVADEHGVARLGHAERAPEQQDRRRRALRLPAEATATRLRAAADGRHAAGQVHQRHDDADHRRCGVLATALRGGAGAQRGRLDTRLERHPDAAGDVCQREAVGRARHRSHAWGQPEPRGHRLVRRQARRLDPRAEGRDGGLPGSSRDGLHLSRHRRDSQWARRHGVHRHRRHHLSERWLRADRRHRRVGPWNVVPGGAGKATDDGFTSYTAQVGSPPRTRWGDYGAAAVDGKHVWLASEYIAAACDYTTWGGPFFAGGTGDNLLGTCAGSDHGPGPRTALGNWSTFVSHFVP